MARECHCHRSHGMQAPSPTKIPQKCWNGKTNFPPLRDHRCSTRGVHAVVDVDSPKTLETKIGILMDSHDRHDARLRNLEADQVLWKLGNDDEGEHQKGMERVDSSSRLSFLPNNMSWGSFADSWHA